MGLEKKYPKDIFLQMSFCQKAKRFENLFIQQQQQQKTFKKK